MQNRVMKRRAETTRRDFLKAARGVAAVSALADVAIPRVYAAQGSMLKLGLIGCGGRGTGAVVLEFPHGLMLYGFMRNANNCFNSNRDVYHGTKGRCYYRTFQPPWITDLKGNVVWRADESLAKTPAYEQEQIEFLDSIRTGKPLQQGKLLADCAMTCVLGQLAIYTGQQLTWKEVVQSEFAYLPDGEITWDTEPPVKPGPDGLYPVPVPGQTSLKSRFA